MTGTVKDLRAVIEDARRRLMAYDRRTILFIDEIHRFNRSQQDALLHAVENRTVIMVGATTENPYFEVNTALLSGRAWSSSHRLQTMTSPSLVRPCARFAEGARRQVLGDRRGRRGHLHACGGRRTLRPHDARARERDCSDAPRYRWCPVPKPGRPCPSASRTSARPNPRRGLPYDKDGDMHYDIISAFIKSMRGSDPDAAVYWLARMIDARRGSEVHRPAHPHRGI